MNRSGLGPEALGAASSGEGLTALKALKAHPTLDPRALHGVVGEIVTALRPHTEPCDAGVLVSLAHRRRERHRPRAAHDGREQTGTRRRSFAALVGQSARARKGTAGDRALAIMEAADPGWARPRRGAGSAPARASSSSWPTPTAATSGCSWRSASWGACSPPPTVRARRSHRSSATPSTDSRCAPAPSGTTRGPPLPPRRDRPHHRRGAARKLIDTEVANGFANRFLWVRRHRARLLPEGGAGFGDDESTYWGPRLGERSPPLGASALVRRTPDASERGPSCTS